ncbi:MAG: efflux RND transporter periplasmic adaptor subunit [Armatimonadota bacterium]|nr:MAG: efflux RND transporter periplasmic adaptor subunit [Armatimonadota bacterium]
MIDWIKRHRWFLLVAGVLIAVLVITRAAGRHPRVMVAEARTGPLYLRIAASGLVENDSADLAFQAGGKIVRLYVREGDRVAATDLLARASGLAGSRVGVPAGDVIQAPYDGTVVNVYLREGAVAAPGQPVLRLVSSAKPWVTAFIDGEDASHLSPGQKLECRARGYLSEPWEIVVRAVGKEAVPRRDLPGSSRQVRVRCDVAGPAFPLAPGTEVDIDTEVPLVDRGILVPAAAVVHEGMDDWVWVVEDGAVHRREVELGPNNFDLVHLPRGLEPGELVVVTSKQDLTEGRRVKAELAPARSGD